MNNFTFSSDIGLDTEKIKLYKDVFGGLPWNEGFLCENCGKNYNKQFMGQCSCGKSKLKPFYKNSELKTELQALSTRQGYNELIAKILNKQIGFIWGWNTNIEDINEDKLGLDKASLCSLIDKIKDEIPDFDLNNFYYLAEIGVKNEYRGQNIARELYSKLSSEINKNGTKYILVRTTKKTDLPFKWFLKMGYKEVFSYNDEQDRVILVFKI